MRAHRFQTALRRVLGPILLPVLIGLIPASLALAQAAPPPTPQTPSPAAITVNSTLNATGGSSARATDAATATAATSGTAPFSCPFCDLSNAQFAGKDLSNANLQGANLTGANLSGANLSGVMLGRANLSRADLSNANLGRSVDGHADLSDANLSGVNFKGAKLAGANFQYTDLQSFSHVGVDLSQALIVTPKTGMAGAATADAVNCGAADLSPLTSRVYVAQQGTDSASCGTSLANACATIATGQSRCGGATGCGVLVMYGEYRPATPIALVDGIKLYGGCLAGQPGNPAIQSLVNAPPNGQAAMTATGVGTKGVLLQGFRLQGSTGSANAASTALSLTTSRGVSLVDSQVLAGQGGPGSVGNNGNAGQAGAAATGATAGTTSQCTDSAGGNGSVIMGVKVDNSAFSFTCNVSCSAGGCWGFWGAKGAAGGQWGSQNCTECASSRGGTGLSGGNGNDASCGAKGKVSGNVNGSFAGNQWQGGAGGSGGTGYTGGGGGGGGAGGYKAGSCFWVKTEDAGNQGGGGGGGGCAGGAATGGHQGGGSFGIVLAGSSLTLTNTPVVGGRGGNGGQGGTGGQGGARGAGAGGLSSQGGGYGGTGGTGGAGGAAGGGAGGNGGPSINVALANGSSLADAGTVYYTGQSGNIGGQGPGGQPIVSGVCAGGTGDNGLPGTVATKQVY